MSYFLRKLIRKIIIEGFAEDFQSEIVDDPVFDSYKEYLKSGSSMLDQQYRPWSKTYALRKKMKVLFSKYSNQRSFDEVRCIHWLNFVPESRKVNIETKLLQFIGWYPPGTTKHKNELSTMGYLSNPVHRPLGLGIILDKKYVTFAAEQDLWSEETKYAFRTKKDGNWIKDPKILVNALNKVVAASYDAVDSKLGPLNIQREDGLWYMPLREPYEADPDLDWRENYRRLEANILLRKEDEQSRKDFLEKLRKKYKEELETGVYREISLSEYFENSGIPKRPSLRIRPENVVLKASDADKTYIDEIICDNWSWSSVYIGPDIIISNETLEELQNKNIKILRRL